MACCPPKATDQNLFVPGQDDEPSTPSTTDQQRSNQVFLYRFAIKLQFVLLRDDQGSIDLFRREETRFLPSNDVKVRYTVVECDEIHSSARRAPKTKRALIALVVVAITLLL